MLNDILMMVLLVLNLVLIVFDFIFRSETVQAFLLEYVPAFFHFYQNYIHKDFVLIDTVFVLIFLTEFAIRWVVSVAHNHYHKWFFFPFVHWYDLLGCIPVGSLRFLRILRVFSIVYRLHRIGVINLSNTYLFSQLQKYWDILMEEISDRVVVNILRDVKEQVSDGNPILERLVEEVIIPHKPELVNWVSYRIAQATEHNYKNYQEEIKEYVDQVIAQAIEQNRDIKTLEQIPLVGSTISSTLQRSISDIAFNVINTLFQDMASPKNHKIVAESMDIALETLLVKEKNQTLSKIVVQMVNTSLDLVIEQVQVKQWLLKELEQKEKRKKAKALKKQTRAEPILPQSQ